MTLELYWCSFRYQVIMSCLLLCIMRTSDVSFPSPDCFYLNLSINVLIVRTWIFDEASDDCCPPAALLSRFGPCGIFLFPEVKILTKRSPISDGRGDRRKFDKGPSRHPAKHFPGRVPELEKKLDPVYQEWRRVLCRRQVWLSCK